LFKFRHLESYSTKCISFQGCIGASLSEQVDHSHWQWYNSIGHISTFYYLSVVTQDILLLLIVCVCLHSPIHSEPRKMLYRVSSVLQSFKITEIGTNRKPICDFLLVFQCTYMHIVYHFQHTTNYWSKICIFTVYTHPQSRLKLSLTRGSS